VFRFFEALQHEKDPAVVQNVHEGINLDNRPSCTAYSCALLAVYRILNLINCCLRSFHRTIADAECVSVSGTSVAERCARVLAGAGFGASPRAALCIAVYEQALSIP